MTWFDLVVFAIIIFAVVRGFISGLIMQLASLAGLIVCAFFAGQIAALISPYIIELTKSSGYLIKPISYLCAFILIMIAFLLLGKLLEGVMKTVKINFVNRLAGGAFSVVKWLIVVSILLNLIVGIDKNEKIIKAEVKEKSYTYKPVKAITPYFIPFLGFEPDKEE